jgi:hypothetical protein
MSTTPSNDQTPQFRPVFRDPKYFTATGSLRNRPECEDVDEDDFPHYDGEYTQAQWIGDIMNG